MSISEPGMPYFRQDRIGKKIPHEGAFLTSEGNYRTFPITVDSPHEPWCLHFEWGPCSCGPTMGEVFVKTGTINPPTKKWSFRIPFLKS
jgi:hypothetical protein